MKKLQIQQRYTIWYPNTEATIRVNNILRGKHPVLVTVQLSVSERSPCEVGDEVILFISQLDQDRRVKVFEGAQGFSLLRSLKQRSGDADSDLEIYQAIMQMIKHEDHSQMPKTPYYPPFGPKGIAVLLELAKSKKPNVRRFAVKCLSGLPISAETGKALMNAIKDKDKRVQRTSAFALVRQKHLPATTTIAHYARSLPEGGLRQEVFQFLAKSAPQKYDFAGALEKSLKSAEPSAHQTFQESLKALPPRFYVWLKLKVDETGAISLAEHRPGLKSQEVQALVKALTLPKTIRENLIPFSFEVTIGYNHKQERVKVRVW